MRWCARRSNWRSTAQALIQVVYNGMFTPTAQANPPSSPFFFQDLKPPARDVAKAKALLQQAGVTLPVPVTLTVTNEPDIQQAGEVIQSMASEAGLRREAQDDGVRLVAAGGVCRRFPGLSDRLVRPRRSRRQHVADAAHRRHVQLRPLQQCRCGQGAGRRAHRRRRSISAARSMRRCGSRSARTCR